MFRQNKENEFAKVSLDSPNNSPQRPKPTDLMVENTPSLNKSSFVPKKSADITFTVRK